MVTPSASAASELESQQGVIVRQHCPVIMLQASDILGRMTTLKRNDFSILKLIESQMRGSNPADAKQERGLIEMLRTRYPSTRDRAGVPLPDAAALRDLQLTTGDISGANLAGAISNPLDQLAGAARPALVLEQAGIATVRIDDGQEGSLPRWRGTGGGWITEGQNLAAAPLTLSSVSVAARHCGAHVNYSRRLRVGTDGDLQAAIITEMQRVVSQQLEDGLINGTGNSGQPLGLLNQATGSVTFAAATPTFSELLSMTEAIGDADGDISRAVFLMHPSKLMALAAAERTAGTGLMAVEPLGRHQWHVAGIPVLASTLIPEAKVICLDPAAASIVYFGPPQLLVDPFSGSNSTNGNTTVIVSNYVDLGVAEPALVVVGGT